MRRDDPAKHNYFAPTMARALAAPPPPGTALLVHVYHDDWCAVHQGGYCSCDPVVSAPTAETDATKVWEEMERRGEIAPAKANN